MRRALLLSLVIIGASFTSCIQREVAPQYTQLEIRQFQSRTYENVSVKKAMKALVNALQDRDFMIKNTEVSLGIIAAQKDVDVENKSKAFLQTFAYGSEGRWEKNAIIEASTNVTEFGSGVKVRVNFMRKTFDNKGGVANVEQIQDPDYYQGFYSIVDKALFIEKEDL